jgi:adenylate cyclase
VGINTPLRLYELLDLRQTADAGLAEMVEVWERAFALYERKDFATAAETFEGIFAANPADLVAKKYCNRCRNYLASPPDEKAWDNGVDNLTEK